MNSQLRMYAALLGVLFFSSLFSIYTSASIGDYLHYAFTACFVFIFGKMVTTAGALTRTVRLCCIGIGIYCLCILGYGENIQDRIVFGTMFDPNDIAYYVLGFLPFNLIMIRSGPVMKLLGAGNIVLGLTTILRTGSRGGLLGLILVLGYLLLKQTKTLALRFPARMIILVVSLAAFQVAQINVDRFKSIMEVESDYNATDEQGRIAIWKVGLRLIAENPLTGVGFNRFTEGVGRDRQERDLDQARWQTAHNSVIQIGAEAGVPGLILFIALTVNAFKIFRRSTRSSSAEVAQIAEMAAAGFLGQFVSALFLSQAYSAYWAFYIAISSLLLRLMEQERGEPGKTGLGAAAPRAVPAIPGAGNARYRA
ncbi:O-antigen ligase family protein [Geomesophilobacter sediminis]|uniref:O-antigen ligase family protein n=1 Tax=Geomesophilobacter sediminis TaxID=2798584 RepID=A0A8J7M1S7_9BACT|nr:O-antigen ligase family protein [Geomesophilobacter sediminis]MBJ6727099.1 O-antigen ligase family protein [Geomesophilobacter sediminis]